MDLVPNRANIRATGTPMYLPVHPYFCVRFGLASNWGGGGAGRKEWCTEG